MLRRKLTLRAHGQSLVLSKQPQEKESHVLMKGLLWALYLPQYPGLRVEVPAGYRYKPDLLWLASDKPAFWGEAGAVSPDKYRHLLRHLPDTHFAFARWGISLKAHVARLEPYFEGVRRRAPVDIISFASDSETRFMSGDEIDVDFSEIAWQRVE